MKYAEVAVDAPVAHSRTFSYSIPQQFTLEPGQLLWVPFGRRVAQGVVVELAATPQVEVTRDILEPIEPSPLLSRLYLDLARWLSRYYLCSLFAAMSPFLPPGFETQVRSGISAVPTAQADLEAFGPQAQSALQALEGKPGIAEKELVKLLGKGGERELARMLQKGLARRRVDLPRPRIAPRYESHLLTSEQAIQAEVYTETVTSLPRRQQELLRAVLDQTGSYLTSDANKKFGHGVADALVRKGLLGMEWVRMPTNPGLAQHRHEPEPAVDLTPEQADAVSRIVDTMDRPEQSPRSFLLHGVTGSGKTEVYLRAIEEVVRRGQQAIFMVPEIALTPQTLERVNSRFPDRVAVLHSGLTARRLFDQWWEIRDGRYDVVVGPRSALFAPVPRLGLIVIDEEHEWTYKQGEAQPMYHARTVALRLARLTGALVILGSATPDVETYYQAQRGRHRLLELPHRIRKASASGPELARVEICDMRTELREGNRSIFSRQLSQALQECVAQDQQAILFLNRRGSAPIVQCRDCGYVATCSGCSVSLTFHAADSRLWCHRCNRRSRLPQRCRQCGGRHIRQLGVGTQRVVDEVASLLPGVRVDRWDADATRSGSTAEDTMARLTSGETQVLVGTQLVAKGLDVPNVTLVGVVLADIGLYLPDLRSGERAFGLLCQVAGRAGRGSVPGRVFLQTYTPEHYAIAAAARQDYAAMFQQEIESRRQLGNPPFNQLVHLVYQDVNATQCQRQAVATARELRHRVQAQGLTDVEIIGPAPGIPSRLRGRHRWHLVVRGRELQRFLEGSAFPKSCTVDVDPAHLL